LGFAGFDALDGEVVELFGGLGGFGGALWALLRLCFGHDAVVFLFFLCF
jgi:hypothetical protein